MYLEKSFRDCEDCYSSYATKQGIDMDMREVASLRINARMNLRKAISEEEVFKGKYALDACMSCMGKAPLIKKILKENAIYHGVNSLKEIYCPIPLRRAS